MAPKAKSSGAVSRTRKKDVLPKIDDKSLKMSTPRKPRAKARTVKKKPKNGEQVEPVPSTSSADTAWSSDEKVKDSKNDDVLITPKLVKFSLNAYKQSPVYDDLKNKRFNTSFSYERSRHSHADIQIFTPEEDQEWLENVPVVKDGIQGAPGEKYANIFMSIPGIGISSDEDEDKDEKAAKSKKGKRKNVVKGKGKRGRKKSVGYNGTPLADECLLTDYSSLLNSD